MNFSAAGRRIQLGPIFWQQHLAQKKIGGGSDGGSLRLPAA